jgi:predicted O-methyltransferase YrrM
MANEAAAYMPSRASIEAMLAHATLGDAVLVAQHYLRAGLPRGALIVCDVAERRGLQAHSLTLCEAAARIGVGDGLGALACAQRVRSVEPHNVIALHTEASLLAAMGRSRECRAVLDLLVARWPDFPGALALLAAQLFPGPSYREVLAHLHAVLRPATYLEIGVDSGATLTLATACKRAVGVDPAPPPDARRIPANARLHRLESDDFFARESLATAFDGATVDLAFIDGQHLFEQALRDFIHVERWCSPGSTIVLHDCLPPAPIAAARERQTLFWVGDVWKVVDALIDHRPDLRITIVPTAPSGLAIVRGLDATSNILTELYDSIVAGARDVPYPYEPGAWPARHRVVTNDAAGLAAALGG